MFVRTFVSVCKTTMDREEEGNARSVHCRETLSYDIVVTLQIKTVTMWYSDIEISACDERSKLRSRRNKEHVTCGDGASLFILESFCLRAQEIKTEFVWLKTGSCASWNTCPGSVKCDRFIDHLSYCQLLSNNFAPCLPYSSYITTAVERITKVSDCGQFPRDGVPAFDWTRSFKPWPADPFSAPTVCFLWYCVILHGGHSYLIPEDILSLLLVFGSKYCSEELLSSSRNIKWRIRTHLNWYRFDMASNIELK